MRVWAYDGSEEGYKQIKIARKLFRDALRADIGLGEDIFKIAEEKIQQESKIKLQELQKQLGIDPSSDLD
jgi:hypothetical protein